MDISTSQRFSSRNIHSSSAPLTPRTFSGHYSSPGSSLHQSEDPIVIEIGSRTLRAGFANEAVPRCEIIYTEELWRKVGEKVVDKRRGSMLPRKPEESASCKPKKKGYGEIWTFNLRAMKDVGVVEDLVERATREAYNKYLLVDSKSKKIVIPLPPLIPMPLLTAITATLFTHFQPPTVTFFPSPALSTVSAGLRSALVVDIGWHEAVVTPVYELRVIEGILSLNRSKRGGKRLRKRTGEILEKLLEQKGIEGQEVTEEMLDEVISRVVWCTSYSERQKWKSSEVDTPHGTMLIPLETKTSSKPISINVPFTILSKPPELTFFNATSLLEDGADVEEPDDDDLPLPMLMYKTLRECPIDVRATCMARIIVVGRTASIPGLKMRLIDELKAIVQAREGWHNMKSKKVNINALRRVAPKLSDPDPNSALTEPSPEVVAPPITERQPMLGTSQNEEGGLLELQNPINQSSDARSLTGGGEDKQTTRDRWYLQKFEEKEIKPSILPGTIRGVKSLGAWAGGSILAGARVKGVIEVERDKFLSAVAQGGTGFPSGMMI